MTCHSLKMAWKDGGDDDTPSVIATVSWKGGGTTSQVTTDQDRSLNHTLIWRIDNILYVQINVCGRYHCCLKWWLKPQKRAGEVAQLDGEGAVTGRAVPPTIMCGGQKVLHYLFTSRRICSCELCWKNTAEADTFFTISLGSRPKNNVFLSGWL